MSHDYDIYREIRQHTPQVESMAHSLQRLVEQGQLRIEETSLLTYVARHHPDILREWALSKEVTERLTS